MTLAKVSPRVSLPSIVTSTEGRSEGEWWTTSQSRGEVDNLSEKWRGEVERWTTSQIRGEVDNLSD